MVDTKTIAEQIANEIRFKLETGQECDPVALIDAGLHAALKEKDEKIAELREAVSLATYNQNRNGANAVVACEHFRAELDEARGINRTLSENWRRADIAQQKAEAHAAALADRLTRLEQASEAIWTGGGGVDEQSRKQ